MLISHCTRLELREEFVIGSYAVRNSEMLKERSIRAFIVRYVVQTVSMRTRQIIRYRATATLRRPQIKQYTASNKGGGVQHQWEHPTAVSEKYFSSGILKILKKVQIVSILSHIYADKFTHVISKRNILFIITKLYKEGK